MKLDSLVEFLRNDCVTRTITVVAAAITFTLGGLTPVYADKVIKKKSSVEDVNVQLLDDIVTVPIGNENDVKNKEKNNSLDVPLVPLIQPINKPTPPPIGPLTARIVKSIPMHVEGEYSQKDNRYVGRLDVNRDGKRDYKLIVDISEKGSLDIKLVDIRSGKSSVPDMVSVLGEKNVVIYKNFLDGRNLAFLVNNSFRFVDGVNAYATVKVPNSVREKALHDKDAIDGLIFCDVDTGCFNAPYHTTDQIIKNRPQEITDYFEKVLKKTHQAIAHPRFKYTFREAVDYIQNNVEELKSQINEEYKFLGVDKKQYAIDTKLINDLRQESIDFMSDNHKRWARGEPLVMPIAEQDGDFQKPVNKTVVDDVRKTEDKTDYVGVKPVVDLAEKPVENPKTLVKKPEVQKLDNIVVTTTINDAVKADDKPYLPTSTKQSVVGVTDAAGQKQWYEKWWVWTIAGVVVAGAATATAVALTRDSGSSTSTGPDNFMMDYGDYNSVGGK